MMERMHKVPGVSLSGGVEIPQVGFGTFKIPPAQTQASVEAALEAGYRHIDTAAAYMNEEGVGDALAATGMAGRAFVTTKLRNFEQGYDSALRAFEASRRLLRVDVVDLYLVHWPVPSQDRYVETWRALARLLDEGAVRAIGVSNFLPEHIDRIVEETGVVPAVNQLECHPSFSQAALEREMASAGIVLEAYSPLGQGGDLRADAVVSAAERLGVSQAQVVLRWHVQRGHVVIPKSTHVERMRENLDLFSFELGEEDMRAIDALDRADGRLLGDPATYDKSQSPEDMRARGNLV